jgi:Ran GTPase-activating protein (RanGAP) involved in mRNA processing and transport
LEELDLSLNRLGYAGAMALAEGLPYCTALRELDLGSNKIGDAGAKALAKGIQR